MNKQFEQVTEFNKAFNLPISVENIEAKQIELRKRLLLEELDEYWNAVQLFVHSEEKDNPEEARKHALKEILDALVDIKYVLVGVYVYAGYSYSDSNNSYQNQSDICMMDYNLSFNTYRQLEDRIQNFEDKYDLDKINNSVNYLLADHGMLNVFEPAFNEVHASNMSKLEDGKAIYREDGKVLKGKDYFKPNLKKFVA